jgi:hypothetical protein
MGDQLVHQSLKPFFFLREFKPGLVYNFVQYGILIPNYTLHRVH